MSKGRLTTESILRLLILTGFAAFFYQALTRNDILQMIHPQFSQNAKIGLCIFIVLWLSQLFRFLARVNPPPAISGIFHTLFIAALALGLLIPTKSLGSITAEQRGPKHLYTVTATAGQTLPARVLPEAPADPPINSGANKNNTHNPKKDHIYINDGNHVRYMTLFYENTEAFLGRTVIMKGFVFRPPNLPSDQFMVARFEITCCAADGMPSGLLVQRLDSSSLPDDTWVEVQGTLQLGTYQNMGIPILNNAKVKQIPPLSNPYVYSPN